MLAFYTFPAEHRVEIRSTNVIESAFATNDSDNQHPVAAKASHAHPIHIHEIAFEVVSRQGIFVDEAQQLVWVNPRSIPPPPEPWELGFKDTVISYPRQVTRVRAKFATPGQFVWHCHIVEHEDNEMMRPYRIATGAAGLTSI